MQPAPTLEGAYASARRALVELAKHDAATFCELVLKDETTGTPVQLAPMHEEWHRLISREPRVVVLAHYESGKSFQLSIGRVLFELGRNPALRVAIISNTHGQACKIVRTAANYIERSRELHTVFPNLKRGDGPWRDDLLTVRRPTSARDASLVATGLHGAILGSRFDLIILDDILDYESTRTEQQRRTTMEWLVSTAFTRLVARGKVVAVGTAWHRDDAYHQLARQPGWSARRYPVVDDTTGQPRWPERWSPERIEETRAQLGPAESARALDVSPISDEEATFKADWLEAALARGNGTEVVPHVLHMPAGARTVVGVDLGISTKKTADLTALATVMVMPGGSRRLLSVEAGRWPIDEIIRRVLAHNERYLPSTVIVESVAAQAFVADLVRKAGNVPCVGFKTGAGKMSLPFQAEHLAAELAAGRWAIPNQQGRLAPEVRGLVNDLASYSPADHCGDRLAALLMARWGVERGARRVEIFRHDLFVR